MTTTPSLNYYPGFDQTPLYYEAFPAKKQQKGVLIIVHGLGEYTDRYSHVVDYFNTHYSVYIYDQRGYGRSEGTRAHVDRFNDYVEDLKLFVQMVKKRESGQKIFILGHSMGGQVLLNYLGQNPRVNFAGVITSSPNIKLAFEVGPIKKFLALKLSKYMPKLRLPSDVDPKWVSHDPKIVKGYLSDPLVIRSVTVNLGKEVLLNQESILENAAKIKQPILMLHAGDDHICSEEGTHDFFAKLSSTDKQKKIYPGFYHEILNEVEKEKPLRDIKKWVGARA
jgi:acylglycerol lipase